MRAAEEGKPARDPIVTVDDLVDLVQPGGELRGELVQLLAHLAVLGAEAGEHPHVARAGGGVGAEHAGARVARGERAASCRMTSVSLVDWKIEPPATSSSRSVRALVRLPLWATAMPPPRTSA